MGSLLLRVRGGTVVLIIVLLAQGFLGRELRSRLEPNIGQLIARIGDCLNPIGDDVPRSLKVINAAEASYSRVADERVQPSWSIPLLRFRQQLPAELPHRRERRQIYNLTSEFDTAL